MSYLARLDDTIHKNGLHTAFDELPKTEQLLVIATITDNNASDGLEFIEAGDFDHIISLLRSIGCGKGGLPELVRELQNAMLAAYSSTVCEIYELCRTDLIATGEDDA